MKNRFQEIYDACLSNGKFDYDRFERECAAYFESFGPGVAYAGHQILGEFGRFLNAKTHKEPLSEDVIASIRAVAQAAKEKAPQAKSLVEELGRLQKEVERLEVDFAAASGQVGALEEQIRTQKTDFEGRVAAAEQRAANSRTQVSTATRIAKNQIEKRDEELERVIADYADDYIAHAERIAGLEDDLSSAREVNGGLVAENAAKRRTNESLARVARKRGTTSKILGVTAGFLAAALIATGIGFGSSTARLKHMIADQQDTIDSQSDTISSQSNTINEQDKKINGYIDEQGKKVPGYVDTINGLNDSIANLNKLINGDPSAQTEEGRAGYVKTIEALKAELNSSVAGDLIAGLFDGILTDDQKAAIKNEDGSLNVAALLAIDENEGYKGVLADIATSYVTNITQIGLMENVLDASISGLGITIQNEDGSEVKATIDDFRDENGLIDTVKLNQALDSFVRNQIIRIDALAVAQDASNVANGVVADDFVEQSRTLIQAIDDLETRLQTLLGDYDTLKEAYKKVVEELQDLKDGIIINENNNTSSQPTSGSGAAHEATPSGDTAEDENNKAGLGNNSGAGSGSFIDDESAAQN